MYFNFCSILRFTYGYSDRKQDKKNIHFLQLGSTWQQLDQWCDDDNDRPG